MNKNYYDVLGVSKTASDEEIKKLYKKLAKQYHPDSASADIDKFKEAAEAFEVLGDTEKRSIYDRYGTVENHATHSPFDIFNSIFQGRHEEAVNFNVDPHIKIDCNISFIDSVFGCKHVLNAEKYEFCGKCSGNGAKDGKSLKSCEYCGGRGMHTQQQGFFQINTTCPVCNGRKQQIKEKCDICSGFGVKKEAIAFEVTIPAGVDTGMTLVMHGKGNCYSKNQYGHIYCIIYVADHSLFVKERENIVCNVPVMYYRAILGGKINIPDINGKIIEFELPSFTKHDTEFKILKINKGDFIIRIKLSIPDTIDDAYKEMLLQSKNLGCQTVYNYEDSCKKFVEGK